MRFSEHYESFRKELPDRARIMLAMCERVVADPLEREDQERGRTAFWAYVREEDKYLKVVVEPDGEEIVTAHFDRGFERRVRRRQR